MKVSEKCPALVILVGILVLLLGAFLPYMTAAGEMARYIEQNPDRMEIASENLTAGDLKNVPIHALGKVITGIYGKDDGMIANVILLVLGGFAVLTALFAVLKKPIVALVFDVLTLGVFLFLNGLIKEDFIGADKYVRGTGFYAIIAALGLIFAGAVWMQAMKIAGKKTEASSPME